MDKENVVVHPFKGTLLSCEENEALSHAVVWMDLENIILSEIAQTQRAPYLCDSLI